MKNLSANFGRFDKNYLTSWLEIFSKEPVLQLECLLLKGDASDRNYYRTTYLLKNSPDRLRSIIIMQLARLEPKPDFNCIQKFLKVMDIPVPDILRFDSERGLLFLMDCGDTHLVDKIKAEPKNIVHWYKKAIEIIIEQPIS